MPSSRVGVLDSPSPERIAGPVLTDITCPHPPHGAVHAGQDGLGASAEKTIALFTGMAGTLTVARAFTDEQDRRAILDGAKKFYLAAVNA